MRENGVRNDSKWPPLALWPYSAEKIFLIRVCRGLRELVGARPLHLLTQTAPPLKSPTGAFIAAQPRPTPNAAFTSGVRRPETVDAHFTDLAHSVSSLALSVIAARCQIPLFVTCGDIFPRPGEVFPQSGSPWQSTQSSSLCQGLSLWERWMRTQ